MLTVVVLALALAASAATFSYIWSDFRQNEAEEFSARAASEVRTVDVVLDKAITALESTRSLYQISESISREHFTTFAASQLESHPGMQALGWVPSVSLSERDSYEERARQDGFADFTFTERTADGVLVPSGERQTYYPVFFIEPFAGNEEAVGFDLGSSPARLVALEAARDSGEFVITQRITLVQEAGTSFGFLGILADYGGGDPPQTVEERRRRHRGFLNSVFRIEDLLGKHALPEDDGLHVALIDLSAPEAERVLYEDRPFAEFARGDSGFLRTQTYNVGGRDWQLLITPSGDMPSMWTAWEPRAASISAFFLVMLAGGLLVLLLRRNQEIRAAVDRRTLELRDARDQLWITSQQNQAIFDVAGAGIIAIDADEVVTSVNPAARAILDFADTAPLAGLTLEQIDQRNAAPGSSGGVPEEWVVRRALREGRTVEESVTYATWSDGRRVPLESTASPLLDEAGSVIGAVTVFRDISDRIRIDRAKEEFLAMTGHELRTPSLPSMHRWGWLIPGYWARCLNRCDVPWPQRPATATAW